MDNALVRHVTGEQPIQQRRNRELARQAEQLYGQAQIADFKAKATMALAASIMEGAVELNQRRLQLAGGDPAVAAMLGDFQETAFMKARSIQWNLFGFGG